MRREPGIRRGPATEA